MRKGDVGIAKNYLSQDEISELNRLTTMFLDFAEDRARRRQPTTMADWAARTDSFLSFNEREVLTGPGSASAEMAKEITDGRYAEFDQRRHAEEAERAALQEWDDLRALTAIERGVAADHDEEDER